MDDTRRSRSGPFRRNTPALAVAAVLTALACTGCDPLSFIAGFNTGFLAGRYAVGTVEIKTVERTCWQNGVQVPCP